MNVRTTLISLLTLPISLVFALLSLKLMGLTVNTMSLGGLAIAIGSLVDDAVVDVENVYKRLRENRLLPAAQQLPIRTVVFEASREVRMPILNSTLIIIVSFVPLFFLTGMEGRMLVPLGVAFIMALAASTIVALTLTPVLCSYLLGKSTRKNTEPKWMNGLKQAYSKALTLALMHKRRVLGGTTILFLLALAVFFSLGRNFLPPFNEGSLTINVSALPGISLEASNQVGQLAEKLLLTVPEIQTVGRKTGRAELDEHALGLNVSELEAPFVLADRSKEAFLADVRAKLSKLSGVSLEIGQPISHRINAMLSGTRAGIAVKLFGTDLSQMYALGNQIKQAAQTVKGIEDLNVEQQTERPQLIIRPKRELLAVYGITLPEFADGVHTLLGGEVVSQVYEGNQVFDLTLKAPAADRTSMRRLADLPFDTESGSVPLGNLAEITSTVGLNTINRENVQRKLVVSANVNGRDLRNTVGDLQKAIEQNVKLPSGYRIEYGGQFEGEAAASSTLLLASGFAVLIIFLLLYAQFRNVKQAAVVLLNLPLALIGGVLALWLTGGDMNIPAIIGFISLFGIATRNGLLLLSRYNDLHRQGFTTAECVRRGSLDRLYPILMTALCSALALVPLALGSDSPGNEIQSPMAKVILGGLLTSTLLNSFIIPIIYSSLKPTKR